LILVFSFLHPSTTDIYTLSLHDALPIWNSDAPFAQINGAIIHELLAGAARLARALVVGSVPGGDAQPFLADTEMLMEPVAAHGRGGYEANGLVILAQHLVCLALPPGRGAEDFRPRISVALALDADEHRGRGVLVR